jgi:hypothetical protein
MSDLYEQIDLILLEMEAEGLLVVHDDGGFDPTEKGKDVWEDILRERSVKLGATLTVLTN